jgi:hypothetical protein
MSSAAGRQGLAVTALSSLAMGVLAACGSDVPDPAGSGGMVGHISGTSDVEGQQGDPAVGGGGLAVMPVAAMDGPFWELTDQEPVDDPRGWAYLVLSLSEADVSQLDGTVVPIDDEGDFRVAVSPGKYAVCYWSSEIGTRVTGCDAIALSAEGELEASWGEGGFHIGAAD